MRVKTVIIAAALVIVAALIFYNKDLFIAATVDGRPVSRFAVINRTEKQSGKAALDAIINELLIGNEARNKGIAVGDDEVEEEIKTIGARITEQGGGTLDDALTAEGLSRDELKKQIIIQKQAEKILADKIQVSDSDVEQYIAGAATTIPEGTETDYKNQVKDQLRGQKFSLAFNELINNLRAKARINYFIKY